MSWNNKEEKCLVVKIIQTY